MAEKKQSHRGIPNSVLMREKLKQKEEEFHGKDDIFGMTLLTNPGYTSSSRNLMFTSHLKQFVNITEPDHPRVFTNYENVIGKHSSGYVKAKDKMRVVACIPKYGNGEWDKHLYLLFAYDEENDKYHVFEKKIVEDLTEKFGFAYNTETIDSKEVGSIIHKDEVIIKSTSYDEHMNYCYGKNVKFMYSIMNETTEDAYVVSQSLADTMISKEVEKVTITLNDNDVLLNLYGDNDTYKGLPDIGEYVQDTIVCASRRIHNSQMLYDMKRSNLRKVNPISDTILYCKGRVVDITVFSNKRREDIQENSFNRQLVNYLDMQTQFYEQVLEMCERIVNSDSKYTKDVNFWHRKATEVLSDEYRWKEPRAQMFSNMIIEVTVERDVPLSVGWKLTGRYGNKGVISEIKPDDEMPHLETGERIDIIFNSLGVINRLNSQQLFEQSITFITNRTRERLATITDMAERIELLVNILSYFNDKQAEKVKKYLAGLTETGCEEFFDEIQRTGIYVHIPPMWEEVPLFDRIRQLYKDHPWIEKYNVFINRFGRNIKVMKPLVIGEMYIMKLKQSSKKNMSARSTGSISKQGVPAKSNKAKIHQELYSKTPIRIGDQENINTVIGIRPEIMAKLHLFYRSSVVGRRTMAETLLTQDDIPEEFAYENHFYNRNVEILHAFLKSLGLRIIDEQDYITVSASDDIIRTRMRQGELFLSNQDDYDIEQARRSVMEAFSDGEKAFVGTSEEYEEEVNRMIERELLQNKTVWVTAQPDETE